MTHHMKGVRYTVTQPQGYFKDSMGDAVPWFDIEGRVLKLICHENGTVTWELWDRNGEVLEPSPIKA